MLMKDISRRDFLKGTAATVAGAAAMGLLGGSGVSAAAEGAAAEEYLTAETYAERKWKFEVMPKEHPFRVLY